MDSDDELCANAIDDILNIIKSLGSSGSNIWQISGRCLNSVTNKMDGKPFPSNINKVSGKKQRKIMYKIQGEKSNCRKVEILRKYPFPTYDDTKFVTENTIWEKIDREFDSCCVNNIFRVYYPDSPDSLAKGRVHSESRMNS